MKVVLRQKDKDWEIAHGKSYRDEAHLQAFLVDNPTLIPFEDISKDILPPRIMIPEFGLPGSGSTDIVGIDESGGITIIECKLATNPEIKRKVVGQVLEYASFLWRKPYHFVDQICLKRLDSPLAAMMAARLDQETRADWDEADFMRSVSQTLAGGSFRILIAVDNVNEELRRTIEYMSEGPSNLEMYALEVTYFVGGDQEILVPRLHGATTLGTGIGGSRAGRSQWTRDRFFQDAISRDLLDGLVEKMKHLLEFCYDQASYVYWGTGKEKGSFTFHHIQDEAKYSLFTVYSDDRIQINFGYLKNRLEVNKIAIYWEKIEEIGGLKALQVKDDFQCWPTMSLEQAFPREDDLIEFENAVVEYRDYLIESIE